MDLRPAPRSFPSETTTSRRPPTSAREPLRSGTKPPEGLRRPPTTRQTCKKSANQRARQTHIHCTPDSRGRRRTEERLRPRSCTEMRMTVFSGLDRRWRRGQRSEVCLRCHRDRRGHPCCAALRQEPRSGTGILGQDLTFTGRTEGEKQVESAKKRVRKGRLRAWVRKVVSEGGNPRIAAAQVTGKKTKGLFLPGANNFRPS
jgi:hypothetical protein